MAFEITRVDIWAGEIEDQPSALAAKLAALQEAGANLEFAIVRPLLHEGTGVLYVAPLLWPQQAAAGEAAGLKKAGIHALRIAGPDRPGLLSGVAKTVGDAGINISGLSAAAIEDRAVIYVRLASEADAREAAQVLTPVLC